MFSDLSIFVYLDFSLMYFHEKRTYAPFSVDTPNDPPSDLEGLRSMYLSECWETRGSLSQYRLQKVTLRLFHVLFQQRSQH